MSDRTRAAIVEEIGREGPITFARFMELALYGPDGYYERPPVGAGDGTDFVTSPHVHPVFGHLLGSALLELWDLLGRPEPFAITEVGAGDGTLARQLLDALADIGPRYVAVERSAGAREELRRIGGVVVCEPEGIPPGEAHVVLAHELLDNLPFRRFRGDDEILIGLDGDRPVEVCATDPGPDVDERIVPEGALAFVDELPRLMDTGAYALLIDYGSHGDAGGPVHGYREHRVTDDLLEDPGGTDITAGVDFDAIAERAGAAGLDVVGSVTQRAALSALGFDGWMRDELASQAASLNEGRGIEAVRTWTGRSRATLLVDPAALGRLRWLLLARPGGFAPSWLAS